MTIGRSRATVAATLALVFPAAMAVVARVWIAMLPATWSIESLDRFFLYGPFQEHLGRQLAQGRLPGWNPLLGLGINDASDVSLGPLYPPNVLFAVCPQILADELLATAHIALAATALFLLARRAGLGLAAAAVGSALIATGVAFNTLASYASMLTTFSWCPVAFLLARRLADRPTALRALALAGALAMQVFAGYLQIHLYTVLSLPLFFLPVRRASEVFRPLAWAVAAELIALGLAAVTLVPGLMAIAVSWRSGEATPALLHHIFPVQLRDYLQGLTAPALASRGPVYAGPLLAPLLLAGILARGSVPRLRIPALVLTVVAVVLSLGDATPIYSFLQRLPISHWLTGPYKWTYFAALAAAPLAAVGAQAALTPGGLRPLALGVWTGASVLYLLWLPAPPAIRLVSAATICGLAIVQRRPVSTVRAVLAAALPAIVAVTTLAGYRQRTLTPADDPAFFARYRPAYAYLAARQDEGSTFIMVAGSQISPRQGEIEGVAQLNTNGVIVTARLAGFMAALQAAYAQSHKRGLAMLRLIGVRFLMTPSGAYAWLERAGYKRVFTSPAADVWRAEAGLPRAYIAHGVEHLPAEEVLAKLAEPKVAKSRTTVLEAEEGPGGTGVVGKARIVRSSDAEVVVSVITTAPAVLVLNDAWSGDWRARIDGQPVAIRHANWLVRAVEVPAGRHEVVFSFEPVALYAGLAISALTALACLTVLVVGRRSRTASREVARQGDSEGRAARRTDAWAGARES